MASLAEEAIKPEGWWHPKGGSPETAAPRVEAAPPTLLSAAKPGQPFVQILPFESFALSDEQEVVKLYFGLPGAKKLLAPKSVVVTFRKQALEVVAQASPGVVYRLHESILSEHIEPSECKVRVKKDHVLVILQKVYEKCFWEKLGVRPASRPAAPERTLGEPESSRARANKPAGLWKVAAGVRSHPRLFKAPTTAPRRPTVVTTGGTAAPYPVPATPDSAPAAAVA